MFSLCALKLYVSLDKPKPCAQNAFYHTCEESWESYTAFGRTNISHCAYLINLVLRTGIFLSQALKMLKQAVVKTGPKAVLFDKSF